MNNKLAALILSIVIVGGCSTHKPETVVNMTQPGSMNDFISCVGDRVYFAFDKPKAPHVHELSQEAMDALCKQAEWLKKYDYNIEIVGHCDERGTTEYNMALGERRASAAAEYLKKQGICQTRIVVSSAGKDHPICMGTSEEAYAKNRCAVILLKKGSCYVAQPAHTMQEMPVHPQHSGN